MNTFELETYDVELAHNKWHDGCVVWIADPNDPDYTETVKEAWQFKDADGHLFVIEFTEELSQ